MSNMYESYLNNLNEKYKIVIIEDDEGLCHLIQKKLKKAGYKTATANTGEQALRIITGAPEEILLIDFNLPEISGKELVEKLKIKFGVMPNFMVMTGFGDEKIAVEMIKLGAKDYIVKENDFAAILQEKIKRICIEVEEHNQLKANQKMLHDAERLAGVGGWLWYVKSDNWIMSDNWMAMHGCSKKSFSTDNLLQIAHPEDAEKIKKAITKTATIGEPYQIEHKIIRQDNGQVRYIKAFGEAELDAKGEVEIVSGAALDITDKVLAEKRQELRNNIAEAFVLEEKNEIYHNVLHALLHHFNSKFGFFGYINEKGDLVCPSMTYDVWEECNVENKSIVFPKTNWAGLWGESLKTKTNLIKNSNLKVPGGHVQLKNAMVGVIQFQGNLIGQLAFANREQGFTQDDMRALDEICRYISPLLHAELNEELHKKELIEAKEKAEESDRLKSAFLANMSHEIRTPMNGILGFTNLLLEPNLTGEEQKQFIGIIQKSGKRMLDTVNDLIDISRIETGQVQVTTEQTDICREIESLFTFFKPEAEQKGLQLTFDKKLPIGESLIVTDKTKFNSIVTNLIKNALKYTDEGSVKIVCEKTDDSFSFQVKDTGIGIPKDRQKAIFNRFEQADIGDSRAFEGSGLGLAITKAYAEMLGGKIWVESEVGLGSTFFFSLPWTTAQPKNTESENTETEKLTAQSGAKPKILIAEDDDVSFQHLSIVLKKHAREIIHAANGKQAVAICKQQPDIDLILMDIQMPGLDGYEATRRIRNFNKDVDIFAQTAFALSGDREKALDAGCNDYISKPINKKVLLDKIGKLKFN